VKLAARAATPVDFLRVPSNFSIHEHRIPFRGHRIWVREVGSQTNPARLPLLCLHGGPGVPHDYLEPLEAIAASGRRVIFYDQLGCGNSDHPDDPYLWTTQFFVEELKHVISTLTLDRVHILGQSWGGMLAMQYAITLPPGLASLVLASSPSSIPLWIKAANELRRQLPLDVQQTLTHHEQAGTTNSPQYIKAMLVFYRRHVCRLDPWPVCVTRAFDKLTAWPQVYHTMWGPTEFFVTGSLKDWDVTDQLHRIHVPALITSGKYDEATPEVIDLVHKGITGSTRIEFANSSHMSHVEESNSFIAETIKFLATAEESTHG
jgi:L-proline amide hydrolase